MKQKMNTYIKQGAYPSIIRDISFIINKDCKHYQIYQSQADDAL